jgi:hypothetical protein
MAAPTIQISYNDSEIRVYWDFDSTGTYASYNLYWSVASDMAGEALIKGGIPNTPDFYYSNRHIFYKFKRETIGQTINSVFYMRLKGVNVLGVEDAVNPSAIEYVPSLPELSAQYKAVEIHGFDYTNNIWRKVKVTTDGTLA